MRDVEFVEFDGNKVSFSVVLEDDEIALFKEAWSKVKGCQPPLIEANRNGLNIHIPWIMRGQPNE